MRRVILPQAFKIVLPPYGNIMIMMLKDSSQASTITVAELALQGKLIASSTFQNTTVFTLVALLYLCMSMPLIFLVARLEKRFGRSDGDDRAHATSTRASATNHVIRGFSTTVSKGEVVCIIGPSGSGKSTILRCINGLESYDAGTIDGRGPAASTARPPRSSRSAPRSRWCSSASTSSRTAPRSRTSSRARSS